MSNMRRYSCRAILQRVIAGGPERKTRIHDEEGNCLDARGLSYAPRTFGEAAMRVIFGLRPERPWISYRATDRIATYLRPTWRVAEFGSGMSTLWFARRVAFLLSIEANPYWHGVIARRLAHRNAPHVRHELRARAYYSDLSEFPDEYFDFVLVDGEMRRDCVRNAIPKLVRGGLVYLDNTDKRGDPSVAKAELLDAVQERAGSYEYFLDFVPCQLIANQGLLARL